MLIWDFYHSIPFNDVDEVQGPSTKILAIQMRSKSQHVQSNPTTTQSSQGNQVIDRPKPLSSSQNNPINIHTWETPKLDYNAVECLKNMKSNISIMDMCMIPQQNDFLL
jgi:hypothetical protein